MPLIHAIEVASFLNHRRIQPWRPDWRYQRFLLGGLHAAMNIPNGRGKSTLVSAILGMLAWHPKTLKEVRTNHCAPPDYRFFTHFRVEITNRNVEQGDLLMGLTGPVDGDHMVFGIYGNAGENNEFKFYAYRGTFDDCPLATREGSKVSMIDNDVFLSNLNRQPGRFPSSSKENQVGEWKRFVGEHFDMSAIQQQLKYQLEKGAEGSSHYFDVSNAKSRNYGGELFYKHLAPELLTDVMGGMGEDDEKGIEDTIHEKAKGVILANRRTRQTAAELEGAKFVLEEFEKLNGFGSKMAQARRDVERHKGTLSVELTALENVLEKDPVVGVPGHPAPEHPAFYTHFVIQDGGWWITDRGLGLITGEEPKRINERAERNRVHSAALKISQVIDIACDPGSSYAIRKQGGGTQTKIYNLHDALALLEVSSGFAHPWTKEAAVAGVEQGFKWATDIADTNPARRRINEIERLNQAMEAQIADKQAKSGEYTGELNKKKDAKAAIENSQGAWERLDRSGLFSPDELADPRTTGQAAAEATQVAIVACDDHSSKVARLQPPYGEWQSFTKEHGESARPGDLATTIKAQVEIEKDRLSVASRELDSARDQRAGLEKAVQEAVAAFTEADQRLTNAVSLSGRSARYAAHFEGEDPVGLETRVKAELGENRKQTTEKREALVRLEGRLGHIQAFEASFPGIAPAVWLNERKAVRSEANRVLTESRPLLTSATQQLARARSLSEPALVFWDYFAEESPEDRLERAVRKALSDVERDLSLEQQRLAAIQGDLDAIDSFTSAHPDIEPQAWLAARNVRREQLKGAIASTGLALNEATLQRALLDESAIAPGPFARRVVEVAGGEALPLHAFVDGLGLGADRRSEVLTLFSALLFAPVFEQQADAVAAAVRLAEEHIEFPVFLQEALAQFSRGTSISYEDGIAKALWVGVSTRQVDCLLDPNLIEREKAALDAQIADLSQTMADHTRELKAIDSQAEEERLAGKAADALLLGLPAQGASRRAAIEAIEKRLPGLRRRASEEAIAALRSALELKALLGTAVFDRTSICEAMEALVGKEEALSIRIARAEDDLNKLAEAEDYEPTAVLAAEAISEAVPARAGRLLLELGALEGDRPRLQRRASDEAIEAIRAMVQLAELLEGRSLDELRAAQTRASNQKTETEAAFEAIKAAILKWEKESRLATGDYTQALESAKAVPVLERIQAFLEEPGGGPEFMASSADETARLDRQRNEARKRSDFDFEAAHAFVMAGGADQLRLINAAIAFLQGEIDGLQDDIVRLNNAITALNDEKNTLIESRLLIDGAIIKLRQALHELRDVVQEPIPVGADQLAMNAVYGRGQDWRSHVEPDEIVDLAKDMRDLSDELAGKGNSDVQEGLKQAQRSLKANKDRLEEEIDSALKNPTLKIPQTARVNLVQSKTDPDILAAMLASSRESYDKNSDANDIAQKHLQQEWSNLSEWLRNFTMRLPNNFAVMKKMFAPRENKETGKWHAGFLIDGTIIDGDGIRAVLDDIIRDVEKLEDNEEFAADMDRSVRDQLRRSLRDKIRDTFYRRVIIEPRMKLLLPAMSDRPLDMSPNMSSSGQGVAITFLWILKLADFVNEREILRDTVDAAKRRRRRHDKTSFTFLDGAFSHLSDKRLIESTLDGIEDTQGRFQLIITGHDPAYQNDFKRFPAFICAREIGGNYMYAESHHNRMLKPEDVGSETGVMEAFHAVTLPRAAKPSGEAKGAST